VSGEALDVGSVAAKSLIGFVPQDLALYPDLSARENMTFFARLYGLSKGTIRGRVDEVLELVGLSERADDRAAEYSGGMKRRLNIGIGLLHRPRLVGVDPQSRNSILESIQKLGDEGMAVLYTTHYMEEAERLCNRIGIIDQGELKAEGTHRELVNLIGERDKVRLEAQGGLDPAATLLKKLNGVVEVTVENGGLNLIVDDARSLLPTIIGELSETDALITNVVVAEPDLETVFLHLTGRALRD
jgi:ABC-2 type transport system ATP-binding protein